MITALLQIIFDLVGILLHAYYWVVIVSAIMSWIRPDPTNPVVRFLRSVTEPVFYRVRKAMPFVMVGGFDLSPLVVLLGIYVAQRILGVLMLQLLRGVPVL